LDGEIVERHRVGAAHHLGVADCCHASRLRSRASPTARAGLPATNA
jgi:hypothetical protein